jgi:hypothetical protein
MAANGVRVLEFWSDGVLEYWSVGVMECWSNGVVEFGLLSTPVPHNVAEDRRTVSMLARRSGWTHLDFPC